MAQANNHWMWAGLPCFLHESRHMRVMYVTVVRRMLVSSRWSVSVRWLEREITIVSRTSVIQCQLSEDAPAPHKGKCWKYAKDVQGCCCRSKVYYSAFASHQHPCSRLSTWNQYHENVAPRRKQTMMIPLRDSSEQTGLLQS